MLVYERDTGNIIARLTDDQNIANNFVHYPTEYRDSLGVIYNSDVELPLRNFFVKEGRVVRRSDEEIQELHIYGRILSERERVSLLLSPSDEEIQKAENTVEILSILQEVM